MKFILNVKSALIIFLSSTQLVCMENATEEKHTEFLFRAIEHYEEEAFENAARIFKRYAGKPVPAAQPFCLDLKRRGYIDHFDPIPSPEGSSEKQKSHMYFKAAKEFLHVKQMPGNNLLLKCLKKAKKNKKTLLLYRIGCLYKERNDKQNAFSFFIQALNVNTDLRAILPLKQILSSQQLKEIKLNNMPLLTMCSAFSLIPLLNQDEGETCAKLSGFFSDVSSNKNEFFLLAAAQFGYLKAQFLWGQYHCANETEILYWMMQCAEWNYLQALSLCGHMLEQGKGTPVNYEKAYGYLNRAAHHPEATDVEFSNFGLMHEQGKGTPVNLQEALKWYQKSYEVSPEDKMCIYDYGRVLSELNEHEKALPLLALSQNLNEYSLYNYAVSLTKVPLEKRDMQKSAAILWKLAVKSHIDSACSLVKLIVNKEIPYTNEDLEHYKNFLEMAIQKESLKKESSNRNTKIADAYIQLRNLYIIEPTLFWETPKKRVEFSKQAFQFDPTNQFYLFNHARDLKENGQYEEALNHFLFLQKAGYLVSFNTIGSCYDLLAKQTGSPSKASQLVEKALTYYRKELENFNEADINKLEQGKAAFNIYSLSCQRRISPLSDAEMVKLLEIAIIGEDEDALNDLGAAYIFGSYGLEPDLEKAEFFLRKAGEKGVWQAKLNLMHLKFTQQSAKAAEEGRQLWKEIERGYPEEFSTYLQRIIQDIKRVLKEEQSAQEEDITSSETSLYIEEDFSPENSSKNMLAIPSEEPQGQNLALDQEAGSRIITTTPPVTAIQGNPPILTKQEKKKQEEQEGLQKKYERMVRKVEALRGKKQTKYRKIQTLIGQHINNFGGCINNASGSGRRIHVGGTYSGFHQPHTADIKGGPLNSLVNLMDKGAGNSK